MKELVTDGSFFDGLIYNKEDFLNCPGLVPTREMNALIKLAVEL